MEEANVRPVEQSDCENHKRDSPFLCRTLTVVHFSSLTKTAHRVEIHSSPLLLFYRSENGCGKLMGSFSP